MTVTQQAGAEPAFQRMALMSRRAQQHWAGNGWRPGPHTQLLARAGGRVWKVKRGMQKGTYLISTGLHICHQNSASVPTAL